MNQRTLVAPRCLVQLLGALALAVVAMAGVQLIASASADAQENVVDTPVLTARDGASADSVAFTWTADDRAVEYEVATGPGTTCAVQVRSLAQCTASPGNDVCIAVQGKDASGLQGLASDWLCVTGDPLLVQAETNYVGAQFQMGLVAKDRPVPGSVGANDCIVDLSYYPSRYLCLSEAGLNEALPIMAAAIADNPVVDDPDQRVFWIGKSGEVPVEDFDPAELGVDVWTSEPRVDGEFKRGETQTFVIEVANLGPLPADSVSVSLKIPTNYVASSAVGEGCVRLSNYLHCLVGALGVTSDAVDEIVFSLTFRDDITELEARLTRLELVVNAGNVSKPGGLPSNKSILAPDGSLIPGDNSPCDQDGNPPAISQFQPVTGGDVRLLALSAELRRQALAALASEPRPEGCDEVKGQVLNNVVAPPGPGDPLAAGWGDPHLITFDRLRYDFQGAGEYVLARSTVDDFVIHSRFFRANRATLSWLHGYAAKVGTSVVTFNDDAALGLRDPSVVAVDGVVVAVTSTPTAVDGAAGSLKRLANGDLELAWADGSILTVGSTVGSPYKITVAPERWGQLEGLSGDADGDTSNDLRSADDTPFVFASDELYSVFGQSWRIAPADSLFVNELNFTAVNPVSPSSLISLEDFSAAILAQAEAACRAAGIVPGPGFAECVLDLAATQDVTWLPDFDFLGLALNGSVEALARLGLLEDDVVITVPTVATGEISVSRAVDVYRFDLEADSVLEINAFGGCPETRSFRFVLEAPNGDLIARSSGAGCGRIGLFGLPETGEYNLRVYDDFGATGAYELSITLPESSLRSYQLEATATGSIEPGGEVYQVFAIAQDNTEVIYDNLGCSSGIGLELIDATGAVAHSGNCTTDFPQFLDAGVWSLRLYSANGNGGTYTFRMFEPERSAPQPISSGETIVDGLVFPFDVDTFTFELAERGEFQYRDFDTCFNARLDLIDPGGNVLGSPDILRGGTNCRYDFYVPDAAPGEWTLQFVSTGALEPDYRFELWSLPERSAPQSIELNTLVEDGMEFPRDVDTFTFEVPAGGAELQYVDFNSCSQNDTRLDLIDPDGNVLGSPDILRGGTSCINDFYVPAAAPGIWTMKILSTSSGFDTSYQFQLYSLPERSAPQQVELNTIVDEGLEFPQDVDTFTFEVPPGASNLYYADFSSCRAADSRLDLIGPDGNTLSSPDLQRGGATCNYDFLVPNPPPGIWTMKILSTGSSFDSSYRFRLTIEGGQ